MAKEGKGLLQWQSTSLLVRSQPEQWTKELFSPFKSWHLTRYSQQTWRAGNLHWSTLLHATIVTSRSVGSRSHLVQPHSALAQLHASKWALSQHPNSRLESLCSRAKSHCLVTILNQCSSICFIVCLHVTFLSSATSSSTASSSSPWSVVGLSSKLSQLWTGIRLE